MREPRISGITHATARTQQPLSVERQQPWKLAGIAHEHFPTRARTGVFVNVIEVRLRERRPTRLKLHADSTAPEIDGLHGVVPIPHMGSTTRSPRSEYVSTARRASAGSIFAGCRWEVGT